MNKRWTALLIFLGIVTLLNCLLLPRRLTPRVDVESMTLHSLTLAVRAPGMTRPKQEATLRSEFAGPVIEKRFKQGDSIRSGHTLLVVGRERILADIRREQDVEKAARARVTRARKDLRLQRALFDRQAVGADAVDEAKDSLSRAQQAENKSSDALHALQKMSHHDHVVAPFSGTVVADFIGDKKSVSTDKDIATVADLAHVIIISTVSASALVDDGQTAAIGLPGNPLPQNAVVSHFDPALHLVTLRFSSDQPHLQPDLAVDVTIHSGDTEPVLSIANAALWSKAGKPHVWVVDGAHRLRSREVVVGRSNADRVEVVRGLHSAEKVVSRPSMAFVDGMKVFTRP